MNITLYGGAGLTYWQALKIAYDDGKAKGILDEQTLLECEAELSQPEPAVIYQGADREAGSFQSADGVRHFKAWGLKEVYEQAAINAKNAYAQSLVDKMQDVYAGFKEELKADYPELSKKISGFTVSAGGYLQVTAPPNVLNAEERELLNGLLNETKDLNVLTLEHAKAITELVKLDKEKIKQVIRLDLNSLHEVIDYGLLLNKGASHLEIVNAWFDQVSKNAKQDEQGTNEPVDIKV